MPIDYPEKPKSVSMIYNKMLDKSTKIRLKYIAV